MAAEESREAMWARMATERKVKDEPVIENVINAIAKPFQLWNPNLSGEAFMHIVDNGKYTLSEILIYVFLTFNMDMKTGKTRLFSRQDLCDVLKYSSKQVVRSLSKLVADGLVEPSLDDWNTPKVPVSYYLPHSHASYQNRTRKSKD